MRKGIAIWIYLWLCLVTPLRAEAEIFQWTDDDGLTHFGDRLPPQYANSTPEVLDSQARTVQVREKAKTAEQLEAEYLAHKAAQEAAIEAEKQYKYDRFLLSTYRNSDEIRQARNNRLEILNSYLNMAKGMVESTQSKLSDLTKRKNFLIENNRPAPELLDKNIRTYSSRLRESRKKIGLIQDEIAEVKTRFNKDEKRYLLLKNPAYSASAE